LNTLAAITAKKAGFKSLDDTWADTTTSHRRLMLTVLGGLAGYERDLIRARTGEGRWRAVARSKNGPPVQTHRSLEARGDQAPRAGGNPCRHRAQLQRQPRDDFTAHGLTHATRICKNFSVDEQISRFRCICAENNIHLNRSVRDCDNPQAPDPYRRSGGAGRSSRGTPIFQKIACVAARRLTSRRQLAQPCPISRDKYSEVLWYLNFLSVGNLFFDDVVRGLE
jgi:hypothetical protein